MAPDPIFREMVIAGLLTGAPHEQPAGARLGDFDTRSGTWLVVNAKKIWPRMLCLEAESSSVAQRARSNGMNARRVLAGQF
jgi:hypothetical protein